MRLIIEDEEGRRTIVPFSRDEISIGRLEGNTIRLTERNVSRRHARLLRQSDAIVIEDLGSYNGVRVNGERVDRTSVHAGDVIEIGDYDLAIDGIPVAEPAGDTNPNGKRPATGPSTLPPSRKEDAPVVARPDEVTNPNAPAPGRPLSVEESPRLTGTGGSVLGRELRIPTTNSVVGRESTQCDVVIDNESVSKRHARFFLDEHTWSVQTLDHQHPVLLNGRAVDSSLLASGDIVEIGALRFRFTAPLGDVTYPSAPYPMPDNNRTQISRRPELPKSKTPLIIGGVVGAVVIGVVLVVVIPKLSSPKVDAPTSSELCDKAMKAKGVQDWAEVVSDLSLAKRLNTACTFSLDAELKTARDNLNTQSALENADRLEAAEKYHEALQVLLAIPTDSPLASAAKLKGVAIKSHGVEKLSGDARRAIDAGHWSEAGGFIEDLRALDPAAASLGALEKELQARKESASSASSKAAEPKPAVAAAPPIAVPAGSRSVEERNQMADAEINDGVHLIMTGDFKGGRERLEAALAEDPDNTRKARIHKNIGIAFAQKGQASDAIPHLKIYLSLQPDAPDRAKFEAYIKKTEGKK